jgi:hypothetical protein
MKIAAITELMKRQDSEEVMQLSLLLNEIEGSLNAKTITEQEYVELMVDADRLWKIIGLKNKLELNQMIHDAILGIVQLAKLVKP